jgi:hypothetical protein
VRSLNALRRDEAGRGQGGGRIGRVSRLLQSGYH